MNINIYLITHILLFIFFTQIAAQTKKNHLNVLDKKNYKLSVKLQPEKELVDLELFIPDLILDIRYATKNNFTKQVIYNQPKAFARKNVAKDLSKAQKEFLKLGYVLKIFDAYRPYSATVLFFEIIGDTRYVASPAKGSKHNRGCAIDLTLSNSKTLEELNMPTEFDSFRKEAWSNYPLKDRNQIENRSLLISIMSQYGFQVNPTEWWHFDHQSCKGFELLDVTFEDLQNN
ncbi:M15 family metallopeptidase [Leptospira sp. GIMC2001]|uniref:M15 family metallopeptidase n=1 Tax=Leptospira sp. GIMC2001 TaxID=1513297 RepID=UPI0004A5C4C0|nr:M15 family metallopeptidase [Leptospira sp. GIMC2001]AID56164.1 beta-lactamase [Leptospira sp. GIMC2001]WCL49757.1 M15 family metallopeptidase [Leptospira sp. GIMC2001]